MLVYFGIVAENSRIERHGQRDDGRLHAESVLELFGDAHVVAHDRLYERAVEVDELHVEVIDRLLERVVRAKVDVDRKREVHFHALDALEQRRQSRRVYFDLRVDVKILRALVDVVLVHVHFHLFERFERRLERVVDLFNETSIVWIVVVVAIVVFGRLSFTLIIS